MLWIPPYLCVSGCEHFEARTDVGHGCLGGFSEEFIHQSWADPVALLFCVEMYLSEWANLETAASGVPAQAFCEWYEHLG